jgi:hypothetical protein
VTTMKERKDLSSDAVKCRLSPMHTYTRPIVAFDSLPNVNFRFIFFLETTLSAVLFAAKSLLSLPDD